MLTGIHIKDFAIVESLDLDCHPGMTVITGETGAGKSIMLDALGLVLGDRADAQSVRPGAERCDISASFDLSALPAAQHYLQEQALSDDEECILRRTISREGRSKSYINQHPVTLTQLKTFGEFIIQIHSQHAQQLLLRPEHQRQWLDQYAHVNKLLSKVSELATLYHQKEKALEQLRAQVGNPDQLALFQYQLQELDELDCKPGEFESLESAFKLASKAEQTLDHLQAARDLLDEQDPNIISLLNQAMRSLSGIKIESNELTSIHECLQQAQIQCEEASAQLQDYQASLDADPQTLQKMESRLDKIHALARKHHCEPEQLVDQHLRLKEKLFTLQNSEDATQALEQAMRQLLQEYRETAAELTQKRQAAAKTFAKKIEQHIHQLGMPKGQVEIQVTPDLQADPCQTGQDKIEFLVRTNPGLPLSPLAKVASGGELSRISLAIQVITAQKEQTATLIFDEVDVGIGGSTAAIVGRLLRELGQHTQVICVTHQPQVAACGHQHLRVEKISQKGQTTSHISSLTPKQRIDEIARMLGGLTITETTTAHAEALMAEALG